MYSKKLLEKIKTEGLNLTIDKEVLDDQRTLEISTELSDNAKVEKEEKLDFENFKVLYKGAIDEKCTAEYGACDDTKLWEDIAKEMFLKSADYIPEEDKKADGELEKKEESKPVIERHKMLEQKTLKKESYLSLEEIAKNEDVLDVVDDMIDNLTKLDDAWRTLDYDLRENIDSEFREGTSPSFCIRWLYSALEDIKELSEKESPKQ